MNYMIKQEISDLLFENHLTNTKVCRFFFTISFNSNSEIKAFQIIITVCSVCSKSLFCTVQWLSRVLHLTGGGQCLSKPLFTENGEK